MGRRQVTGTRRANRTERKALIAARADLERARMMLALHEIKAVVGPASASDRVSRMRPVAAMLVGLVGPIAGTTRTARWLRIAWFALVALRVARNWK
jgi:hypothetical protein